jgi:hypothetical protein
LSHASFFQTGKNYWNFSGKKKSIVYKFLLSDESFPTFIFRGENKAAIEVAKREGRTLNGGKYEIYDLDEETLWERIDATEGWWKDSTWTRLIQRELPDLY